MNCPLCRSDRFVTARPSNDSPCGVRAVCEPCAASFHYPDPALALSRDPSRENTDAVRLSLEALLDAALANNPLNFLLMHAHWHGPAGPAGLVREADRRAHAMAQSAMGGPAQLDLALPVLAACLNTQGFGAYWLNAALINAKFKTGPTSWHAEDAAPDRKHGAIHFKNCRIMARLFDLLWVTGFEPAARGFGAAHLGFEEVLRDSVLTAGFVAPADPAGLWHLARYAPAREPGRGVDLTHHFISHDQLLSWLRHFLAFREAAATARQAFDTRLRTQAFQFQATNQVDPDEPLDCLWNRGVLEVPGGLPPGW